MKRSCIDIVVVHSITAAVVTLHCLQHVVGAECCSRHCGCRCGSLGVVIPPKRGSAAKFEDGVACAHSELCTLLLPPAHVIDTSPMLHQL
jgi:hypothetical protein